MSDPTPLAEVLPSRLRQDPDLLAILTRYVDLLIQYRHGVFGSVERSRRFRGAADKALIHLQQLEHALIEMYQADIIRMTSAFSDKPALVDLLKNLHSEIAALKAEHCQRGRPKRQLEVYVADKIASRMRRAHYGRDEADLAIDTVFALAGLEPPSERTRRSGKK